MSPNKGIFKLINFVLWMLYAIVNMRYKFTHTEAPHTNVRNIEDIR